MQHDHTIPPTQIQAALSEHYVGAIAAAAGYTTGKDSADFDSIDLRINGGHPLPISLDLQLKSTTLLKEIAGSVHFDLPIKNYNDLRKKSVNPRYLVVYDMPRNSNNWIDVGAECLSLHRKAYWWSLEGAPATSNVSTVTVRIPMSNTLTVTSLRALMDAARRKFDDVI